MKRILFLSLVLSLFIACRSSNKQTGTDSSSNSSNTKIQSTELIKRFKPIIQGVWVKADYVNKVLKTKSPLAAVDEVNDITTMYIDTYSIKGDSIIVPEGAGNHDGSWLTLKFEQGENKSALRFGAGELSYSIKNHDTLLTYSRFDKEKK